VKVLRPPEDVFCIPAGDLHLVFSPLRNIAAALNKPAADRVRAALSGDDPITEGPLLELTEALSVEPVAPEIPAGPARPPFLGLILTRGCNMACRYCDFASSTPGDLMSPQLLSQAIAAWARWIHDAKGDSLDLHFFGGEPFTQPDLVEIAVHGARQCAAQYGMRVHVEASTNGILSPMALGFVRDHFSAIVLSLDGQAEDHDLHRPLHGDRSSFADVWAIAVALSDSPVSLCVRCCVSAANVTRMEEIASWLCSALRLESITFEPMLSNPESTSAGLFPPDPLAFARGFVHARRVAQKAGVDCVYSALSDRPRRTVCPVGRDAFLIAPDRSIRSCYLRRRDWQAAGLDMRIGMVTPEGNLEIDQAAVQGLRDLTADRARCGRCLCRWICAGGCVVTETPPGHSLEYTQFCRQTRLIQVCTLLENLGLAARADELLSDEQAVARLWEHPCDRLESAV